MRWSRSDTAVEDVVVALHGLTGTPERVRRYVPDLAGVRVVAPVLLGHGTAATDLELTLENATADALRALDAYHVGRGTRVHLVGMSLGATLARALAASAELDVVSAAFIRPTHTHIPRPVHLLPNEIVADLLTEDPASARSRLGELEYFRGVAAESPSTGTNLLAKATVSATDTVARRITLLRSGSSWTVPAALPPDHVRSVVIAARDDALHPLAVAEMWRHELSCELHVVEDPANERHAGAVRGYVRALIDGSVR